MLQAGAFLGTRIVLNVEKAVKYREISFSRRGNIAGFYSQTFRKPEMVAFQLRTQSFFCFWMSEWGMRTYFDSHSELNCTFNYATADIKPQSAWCLELDALEPLLSIAKCCDLVECIKDDVSWTSLGRQCLHQEDGTFRKCIRGDQMESTRNRFVGKV